MARRYPLVLATSALVVTFASQVLAQTTAAAPGVNQASQVPPGYVVIDPATGRPMAAQEQTKSRPETLPYREGAPVPQGYSIEESHYNGLIIGGIIPFGVLYAISLSVASGNNFEGRAGWLAVPVVGPFGWLATHKSQNCSYDYCYSSSDEPAERTFVTMDGLFQAAGAALFVTGLVMTRKQLVLNQPQQLYVVPYSSSTAHGIAVLGRF